MNRLPPYSSASVLFHFSSFFKNQTFISLSAGRLTHCLTFIKDGNSASSKRHAASTSKDLEVSKLFGQHGHHVLPVQQGLPTHPLGAGRVQHNKKVVAKLWKWTKWEESAPPTPLRTLLSDSRGSKKDAFDSSKCGNVCAIRTALRALTSPQQGGHFSQRRSILHLLLVV